MSSIDIEEIAKASIKDLHEAYCGHDYGQKLYEHWTAADILLVEEILQEARRILNYYPGTNETVREVIGEDGIAYAQKIAEFRAMLQEPSRTWRGPSSKAAAA